MRNRLLVLLSIFMMLCSVFTVKINADVAYDSITYSEQDMNDIRAIAYPKSFAVYDNNDNKLVGISINYSYKYENEYGFDIHISNATYRAIRSDREKYRLHVTYNDGVTVDHGPLYKIAYQKEESPENIMSYSPEKAKYKELYYVIIDRDIYDVQIGFNNNTLLLNDYSEENGKVIWSVNYRQNSLDLRNAFSQYLTDPENNFTLSYNKTSDDSTVSFERKDFSVSDNGQLYLSYTVDGESGTFILDSNGGGGGSGYEYDSSKSDVTVVIDKDDQGRYTVNAFKAGEHFDTIYGDTASARNALIGAVQYLQGYVKSRIVLNTNLIWNSNIDSDNDVAIDHQYIEGWQIDYDHPEKPDNGLNIDLNGHDITGFRLFVSGSWAYIYLSNSQSTVSNIIFNSGDPAIINNGNVFLLDKVKVNNTEGCGIVVNSVAEKTYIGKDAVIDAKTGVSFTNGGNVSADDLACTMTLLGTINASLFGISFNVIDNNPKHRFIINLDGEENSHSKVSCSTGTGIYVNGNPEVDIMYCDINAAKALEIGGGTYTVTCSKIKSSNGPLFTVKNDSGDSRDTSISIKADSGVELIATDYIVSANANNDKIKDISFYAEESEVENGFIQYGTGLVNDAIAAKAKVRGGCYSKNDIINYLADPALSVVQSGKYQGFYTVVIPNPVEDVTDYEALKTALQSSIVTTINVKNNISGSEDILFDCNVSKRINLNGNTLSGFALHAMTDVVKQAGDENVLTVNNGTLANSSGSALIIDGPRTFLNGVTVNSPNNDAILLKNSEFNSDKNTVIKGKQGIVINENEEKKDHLVSVYMDGSKVNTVDSAVRVDHTTDAHHTYITLKNCNLTLSSDQNPILDINNNAVVEINASYLSGGSCGVDFDDQNIKKVGDNFYSRLRIINQTVIISKTGLHLAKETEFESYDTIIQALRNVIEAYDETHVLIASGYYSSDNGAIIELIEGRSQIDYRSILSGFYSHDIDEYIVNGIRENFSYVCSQIAETGVYKFRVLRMYDGNVFFNPQYIGNYIENSYFTRDIDTNIDLLSRAISDLDYGEDVILSVEDARNQDGIDSFPVGDYVDYFDIYLNRKTENVEEADGYVLIKISYENADDLKIYHKHGEAIYPIRKVAPAYGKALIEECYYVENGAVYIVVKKFSLFGIQDNGSAVAYDSRTITPTYTIPKTGIE